MINEGCIPSDIATRLDISKPHVSYYVKKAKESGYVTEIFQDAVKVYELTQPGKNFLAMYQEQTTAYPHFCLAQVWNYNMRTKHTDHHYCIPLSFLIPDVNISDGHAMVKLANVCKCLQMFA